MNEFSEKYENSLCQISSLWLIERVLCFGMTDACPCELNGILSIFPWMNPLEVYLIEVLSFWCRSLWCSNCSSTKSLTFQIFNWIQAASFCSLKTNTISLHRQFIYIAFKIHCTENVLFENEAFSIFFWPVGLCSNNSFSFYLLNEKIPTNMKLSSSK